MAFAMRDNMVHVKCDKIHRAIRDFKNSMSRCLKGLFLKAQLHSSYIFALNYKPFGSGGFFSQKREMLEKFISTTSPQDSNIWDAFREKIARDLGRELSGDEHEIENMLADVDSFMKKGSLVKASRWFSWNQLCCEQLCEFHVLKMLLATQTTDWIYLMDPGRAGSKFKIQGLLLDLKKFSRCRVDLASI